MRRPLFASLAGALAGTLMVASGAPAVAATDPAVVTAVGWIQTQQQPDGGFEVAGFPGFETADAALAIAEGAQADGTWSTVEALAAVQAVTTGGKDALDSLDDLADSSATAGQAAKLVVLVATPLGLDARDFDPSADSPTDVDLRARILSAAGPGQDYAGLAFNARLYAGLALHLLEVPVPVALVEAVSSAQQGDGGWNFSGDPSGTDLDIDTTGLAIQMLVASGADVADDSTARGVGFLARAQRTSGAWSAFGFDDPNSTSLAILGITAAGGDVATSCWRNAAEPALAGVPYTSPISWLEGRQAADGHIASPNDGFGVNTFATSQSVQAISRTWLPVATASVAPTCPVVPTEERFVHAAYFDILDRLSDDGGEAFFADRLRAGAARASVPRSLTGSREYRNLVIDQLHRTYLERPAGAGEKILYGALLRNDQRLTVESSILATGEYYTSAGGTDGGFVDALYADVLARPADAGGRAFYLARLAGGQSHTQVARALLASTEGRGARVRSLYLEYLRRPADTAGLAYWTDRISSGTSVESFIVSLVASSEYEAKGLSG